MSILPLVNIALGLVNLFFWVRYDSNVGFVLGISGVAGGLAGVLS